MTDAQLVEGSLRGKEECLSELLSRYRGPLYAWIRHHGFNRPDAEDLTQVTLIRVRTRLAGFDPAKGRFRTWLFQAANNLCRNEIRRRTRRPDERSLEGLRIEPSCPGPQEALARIRTGELLWQAVLRLPDEFRPVVVLYFYWQKKQKETAGFLGVSEATVRLRLRRGCKLLRGILAEAGVRSAAAFSR